MLKGLSPIWNPGQRKKSMKKTITLAMICLTLSGICLADWPQYLGPNRNAIAPAEETGLMKSWPEEGPQVLWTVDMGKGFGAPALVGDKVYVLDREGDDADGKDVFRCLDLNTGQEEWRYTYDAPGKLSYEGSRAVPTVVGDLAFTIGGFGHIHCFDLKEKKPVWKKNLLSEFGAELPNWGVAQSALAYGDTIIVSPVGTQAGVVALNQKTGELVWKSPSMGGKLAYVSPALGTFFGVDQVIQISTAGTVAVDAKTGEILWRYNGWNCRIPIPLPTILPENRIFLTAEYGAGSAMIQIARGEDGKYQVKELFKSQQIESQIHQPILFEDHLYLVGNGNRRRDGLTCVDLMGNVKWKTMNNPNFERGGIMMADGLLYVVDGNGGTLYLVKPNPEKFEVISKSSVLGGKQVWGPLAISGGKLVVRDQSQMKCLDVKAP
jgi:outer membrane protein assembly factor BamB